MIGDSGVGKSSLLLTFISNSKSNHDLSPTIGIPHLHAYFLLGPKNDLGPWYDMLIVFLPENRQAIGALACDQLFAPKFNCYGEQVDGELKIAYFGKSHIISTYLVAAIVALYSTHATRQRTNVVTTCYSFQ